MGQTSHPCPECGRVFPKKSNLRVHLRVHTGETPFPCNQCDKKFSWRSSWISHLAWHSGIAKPQKTRGTARLAPTPQKPSAIQPAPTISPDVAGLAFLTANQQLAAKQQMLSAQQKASQQQLEQMMMQQVNGGKQPAEEVQYANHAPPPQQPAMMVVPEQNGRQPVKVQAMIQPMIQPPMQPTMQPPLQPQTQPPPRAPMQPPPQAPIQAQNQNWTGTQPAHNNSNGYPEQRRKSVQEAAMQASIRLAGELNPDEGDGEEQHFSRQQRRKSQMIAEDAFIASVKIGNELEAGYDEQEEDYGDLDDINATLGATNSFSLAHLAPPPVNFDMNPPPMATFGANPPRPADGVPNGVVKQDPGDETMQLSESFTNMLLNGQTHSEQDNYALLAAGQAMSSVDRPTGSFPYGGSFGNKTSSFGPGRPGPNGSGPRIPHAPLPARGIRPPVSNLWTHGSTGSHNMYEGMGDSIVNSRSRMSFSFKGVKSNSVHRSRTSLIGDPLYSFEVQGVQSPFRRSINGMPDPAPEEEAQEPQFFTEDRASYLGFSAAIGTFATPLYDHDQNPFGAQNRG